MMREKRAVRRSRLVHNMARSLDTGFQELLVKYDEAMKLIKVLKLRATAQTSLDKVKKRLGFKEKAIQANLGSVFNVAEVVAYFNRAQIKSSKRGLIKRSYIQRQATDR